VSNFQRTKLYDLLAASPLIVWYGLAVAGLVPQIADTWRTYGSSHDTVAGLSALSLVASLVFLALQIVLFLVRRPPERFSESVWSRIVALLGANAALAFLALGRVTMSATLASISAVLVILGSLLSIYVALWLGRSFSILPQARKLVTSGPYKFVRHPLYLVEWIANLGIMLEFREPWALLIMCGVIAMQFPRMYFEEKILSETYPTYREYQARTVRLIPGIY